MAAHRVGSCAPDIDILKKICYNIKKRQNFPALALLAPGSFLRSEGLTI
jgi:hypothetical protein